MSRKVSLIVITTLLVVLFVSLVSAKDIAIILPTAQTPAGSLLPAIDNLGYDYDIISESEIASTNLSQYKAILVGEGKFVSPTNVPVDKYNSLVLNSKHRIDWGWSARISQYSSPTSLDTNLQLVSPITQNLPAGFSGYNTSDPNLVTYVLNGKKPTNVKIAVYRGTIGNSAIAYLYPNSLFLNNKVAKGRSLYFGVIDSRYWTEETRTAFENSLIWVVDGEDKDGDGYYSEDCNDNNPNLFQNIPGYLDSDEDGFGSGSQLMVCSGDALLTGYSEIEGDCNNVDFNINPSQEEIPYDGKDNDCFEGDMRDVDADGYDAEIVGGEDCNDLDAEFNPNATDLNMNCINDAPVSTGFIDDLEWYEHTNYTLDLSDYFEDPENDPLFYGINSTSNDKNITADFNGSSVTFTTTKDWFGEDWVVFYASDGEKKAVSNNVTLRVLSVEDYPIYSIINNQTINEDNNLTLNLSQYFHDPNGDLLTYFVEYQNNNSHLSIIINGNTAKISPEKNWFGEEMLGFRVSDGEHETIGNNFSVKVNPVNDKPVLNITNKNILIVAGEEIQIEASAEDVEDGVLNVNYTSPVDFNGYWATQRGDEGSYKINVSTKDSEGYSSSDIVNINVISEILINEFVSDSDDEWIELYNTGNTSSNLNGWSIEDNTGNRYNLSGIINGKGFFVVEDYPFQLNNPGDIIILKHENSIIDNLTYGNYDDGNTEDNLPVPGSEESLGRITDGSSELKIFNHTTKNLPNNADVVLPVVELLSPNNTEIINVRNVLLRYSVEDNSENLNCQIYTNTQGNFKSIATQIVNTSTDDFQLTNLQDGLYKWNVKCSDSRNSAFAVSDYTFSISAPDAPIIQSIGDKNVHENSLLTFNVIGSDPDNNPLTYGVSDLPEGSTFKNQVFSWTPSYNQSGLYEVTFSVNDSEFTTSQKVKISVLDTIIPPSFKDAAQCKNQNNSIVLSLDNPEQDDDFNILDKIKVELNIENNLQDDSDFDAEVHLYDISKEESIDSKDDSISVDQGDNGDLEFELEVSKKTDEKHDYVIYVYAEGENGECVSSYVDINIKREDDLIEISSIDLIPSSTSPGSSVIAQIKLNNLGAENQDVKIKLENQELNLNFETEEFELEEYGKKDSKTVEFSIPIPESAEEKNYTLKFSAIYNDKVSEKRTINVVKPSEIPLVNNDLGTINLENSNDYTNYEKVDNGLIQIGSRPSITSSIPKGVEYSIKDNKSELELNYMFVAWIIVGIGIFIMVIGLIIATFRR